MLLGVVPWFGEEYIDARQRRQKESAVSWTRFSAQNALDSRQQLFPNERLRSHPKFLWGSPKGIDDVPLAYCRRIECSRRFT
jgi:hypothetical protein